MTVATAYASEDALGSYLLEVLGRVAETLGWKTPQDLRLPVLEALSDYGASDIASVSGFDNARKLRALGRVQAWRAAVANLAAMHDYSEGGGSASKDQLYRHAKEMLADAVAEAATYSATYAVAIDRVTYLHDPYTAVPDEDRVLP